MKRAKEILTFKGYDQVYRPIYEDSTGKLWMDTDPRAHVPASLYSVVQSKEDKEIPYPNKAKFSPKRITW